MGRAPKIVIIPIASNLRDNERLDESVKELQRLLEGRYTDTHPVINRIVDMKDLTFDIGVVLVLTGGTEQLIMALAKLNKPVVYIYTQTMNSLPALMEALALIGDKHTISATPINDSVKIISIVTAYRAYGALKGMRVGLIGGASAWLVYSRASAYTIRQRTGMELVNIPMDEVYGGIDLNDPPTELVDRIMDGAQGSTVSRKELGRTLGVYQALKGIIKRHHLDAISMRCFDIIEKRGTTACVAFALLNSEGIASGCEGDVPSTVGMIIGSLISEKPVFMANPSYIKGSDLMVSHCTVPLSMVEGYRLMTHFESGLGVGIQGSIIHDDQVTLYRLSNDLRRIRIIVGKPVIPQFDEDHCRTQIIIRANGDLSGMVEDSIGNHYLLLLGDRHRELEVIGKMLGGNVDEIL